MKYMLFLVTVVFFLGGCGDDSDPIATGVHFQGRDCLSCHNKDLTPNSHLSIGGTVYRSATSDKNNLNATCTERLYVNFGGTVGSTKDAVPATSSGWLGRGNIFALIVNMPVESGSYVLQITREDGTVLKTSTSHPMLTGFNTSDPQDLNNRYSCNACHQAPPNNVGASEGLLNAPGCI